MINQGVDTTVKPPETRLDESLQALLDKTPEARKDYFYCAVCSSVVGLWHDRIQVCGSHDHSFVNPMGLRFHIGCFEQALGCSIAGRPRGAESWFSGFKWRVALCSECQRHLGWYFDRAEAGWTDEFFYGLILDRIQYDGD